MLLIITRTRDNLGGRAKGAQWISVELPNPADIALQTIISREQELHHGLAVT